MRYRIHLAMMLLVSLISLLAPTSAQSDATAQAVGQANLRAAPGVDAELIGQISAGTIYPIIGRSELFPWVLLADPTTRQPIGWVFNDLITIQGNLNAVALSNETVSPGAVAPTPASNATSPAANPAPTTATIPPTATQPTGLIGIVQGEVNIRYGPGVDYTRVGVAQAGATFEITGYHTQFPWIQVRYPGVPGERAWIARDLLQVQGDLFSVAAISDSVLNLPTLTPTPSVVSASILPDGTQIALSDSFAALGNQLWNLMQSAGFDLETNRFGALFVLDLQTGEAFSFGGNIAFSGTSVNKIAILARLYRSLSAPPDARIATDIANTMICSENGATNRLMGVIGGGDEWAGAEEVTRFLNRLGLEHSFITSPYVTDPTKPLVPPRPIPIPITEANQTKANPDLSNQLTVEDMGRLLQDIYECGYGARGALIEQFPGEYDPRECRQMLWVMSNNNVDALLKAGVPAETRVAHKHGWIADTHSNAAVFFTPGGNYIIVAMMFQPEWLNFQESLPVMAELSRTIYNYYNPTAPLAAIREGFIPEAPTCNFANTPLITDLRQPIWDQ